MFFLCPPPSIFKRLDKAALLSLWTSMTFTLFSLVKENRASFIASSFSILMCKVLCSSDHCPDVWIPLQTASYPFREASVWIIIFGFNREKVWSLQNLMFLIHQVSSTLNLVFNVITDWQFLISLRHTIYCCRRNLNWIFSGSNACIVDDRKPVTLVNCRTVAEWLMSGFWQHLTTFCTFYAVSDKVILNLSPFSETLFSYVGAKLISLYLL